MQLSEEPVPHAEQLRDSEERLQAFMRHTPALAFMKDADGRYVYVNSRMEATFGVRAADVLGKADCDWLPEPIAAQVRANDQLVVAEGRTLERIEVVPTRDGERRHWLVLKFPFTNRCGERFVGGMAFDVTARVEAEQLARRSEQDLRALFENSPDLLVRFDRQLRVRFANPRAAAAVDTTIDDLLGRSLADIGVPTEQRQILDARLRAVFDSGKEATFEGRFGGRYYHVQLVPECDDAGVVDTVLVASRDVTRLKIAEKRLMESERRYRCLVENNLGLICTHDEEGQLLSVNGAAAAALGYDAAALVGRNLREFVAPADAQAFSTYLERVRRHGTDEGLLQVVARDGSRRTWKYRNALIDEPGSPAYILGSAQDVTELKQAQEAARVLSLTDELTGLLNRRGFMQFAGQHLQTARRTSGMLLLLYADMDGLKAINDRYGHNEGSNAIVAVADVLRRSFRASDLIARVGGDEFVVLVVEPLPKDDELLIGRVRQHLAQYNRRRAHPFDISISLGVSLRAADDDMTLEERLNEADRAMYRSKSRQRVS